MSQQYQQQPMEQSATSTSQAFSTQKKQLLTLIASLQQQVAILLQQNGGARVKVAKSPLFSGKIEEVSMFINVAHLYLSIRITEELKMARMAWVLSYMQGGVAETWRDNLLDKLLKRELEIEMAEELFGKMRNKFGETVEKERKIE